MGAITRIDISHNSLTLLPPEIFSMCSLTYLNAAQNKIEQLPSPTESSYNSPVLEEIYLQDNCLEEVLPEIFRLPSLVTLDISNNKLQKIPFDMWKSPKLRELNIAFNLLKDLPTSEDVSIKTEIEAIKDCFRKNLCKKKNSHDEIFQHPFSEQFADNFQIQVTRTENHLTSTSVSLMFLSECVFLHLSNDFHSFFYSKNELIHQNIWSKSLEIVDRDTTQFSELRGSSALRNLNLSNNLFTSIPPALPCLAENLSRLNMSYNSLRSMGITHFCLVLPQWLLKRF